MINKRYVKTKLIKRITNLGFEIISFLYDRKHFGNIHLKVKYGDNIVLEYIRDRSQVYARINYSKETLYIEDFFKAIGIEESVDDEDFNSMVTSVSDILKNNQTIIDSLLKKYSS